MRRGVLFKKRKKVLSGINKDRKEKKPKARVTLRPEEDCEIMEYAR
ncbi:hypothetical protein MNV_950006 [Candidatus Methanoperedens nitroreducens]|uniref:Uncharacterized protein n=1 Tax=Candidatus Methanoperedens nitratireducens TaxID=1392998 RepID=A0A284VUB9_9EURY|nr:hypothetical protein MNV_950006 [Candidatus Methanoperedens nitroreducens]